MKYAYASRTGNVEEIVNSLGIDALRIDDGSEITKVIIFCFI